MRLNLVWMVSKHVCMPYEDLLLVSNGVLVNKGTVRKMLKYLGPLQGFIIGLCLIIFNKKLSHMIQKTFEKFPQYEDGVKSLNIKFEMRPGYITVLGLIFILIAIVGYFEIIGEAP